MNEHDNKPAADNPLKKAAMATIGAVTGAVEKVADAIGDLASKENIDRMAKKGEEVFDQVKEFGAQTYEKVKTSISDSMTGEPLELDAAKEQLGRLLDDLRASTAQAREALDKAVSEENFEDWADKLSQGLREERQRFDRLAARVRAALRPAAPEAEDEDEDVFVDQPRDSEIPYAAQPPQEVSERMERRPSDLNAASPTAPIDEDNTNKLQSEVINEHIPQQVPPQY